MHPHLPDIFNYAIRSVTPGVILPFWIRREDNDVYVGETRLTPENTGRVAVVGAGKAAAAMGQTVEDILGDRIDTGIIVTKYDHALPLRIMECLEAGHPIPDQHSREAGEKVLRLVESLSDPDLLILLISGGASALIFDLPPGIPFEHIQGLIDRLLRSGADIHEMNTVRKHLSVNIKGGQLARMAYPARICNLVISDVPGDDLGTIASGPVSPDPTRFEDAWSILEKYGQIEKLPSALRDYWEAGRAGRIPETPKPGDPVFSQVSSHIIGNNHRCLEAASERARALGYEVIVLEEYLQGEASVKARDLVRFISQQEKQKPWCVIAGGETTVTVRGTGKGGRNQEFALAAMDAFMNERPGFAVSFLAAGTDGTDGPTDAAGAFFDTTMIARVREDQDDINDWLANNDAYAFFQKTGGLFITGPTQTNVMDILIAIIHAAS